MTAQEGWLQREPFMLHEILRSQAERIPDRPYVDVGGTSLTYGTADRMAQAIAAALAGLGVGAGDVVATLCGNRIEQVYLQFATSMLGAMELMINTGYRGRLLAHQLSESKAGVLLIEEDWLDRVLECQQDLPALRTIVVLDGDPNRDSASGDVKIFGAEALWNAPETPWRAIDHQSGRPCTVTYTSGTTGPSKGVVMSHDYLIGLARHDSNLWYQDPEDAFYSCTPMFHLAAKCMGLIASLERGVRCVLDDRFSVSQIWDRIEENRCSGTLLLGSMMMMLSSQPPQPNEGVDVIVALPIPVTLQGELEKRWKCRFETVYGLSEAVPIAISDPKTPFRPGSAGRVNSETFEVRIVDDDDNDVLEGETGEVIVRPRHKHVMFEGYLNNPSATLAQWQNWWFHTGDYGRIDEDGWFYFVDRKKDYLRRRGENISSYEVESALLAHPKVAEAAVVGVASDLMEDEVMAYVVPREGCELEPLELVEHCIGELPPFAVPRYIQVSIDLPRNPVGKVLKEELRSRGVPDQTFDREAAGITLRSQRIRN